MAALDKVHELVERFAYNHDSYRASGYNEAKVRRGFIDPLFKALGWDLDNEQGYAEAYKEVIHEDAIKIGKATRVRIRPWSTGCLRRCRPHDTDRSLCCSS